MSKLDDALSLRSRLASQLKTPKKIPIGIFSVDMYLDGGVVEGAINTIAGPYHGGKTSAAMKITAQAQLKYPHKHHFWFDIEGTFDTSKAIDHGIDLNKLSIVRPETGGETADMMCALIDAKPHTTGVIVIDSLNTLLNSKEFDKEADEHTMAYNASIVTKLLNRVGNKLNSISFEGDIPTVVAISQIRANLGFGFKDYIIPGAKALVHNSSIILVTKQGKVYEDTENKEMAMADFVVTFDKVKTSSFHIKQTDYSMVIGRDQIFANGEKIPTGFIDDFKFTLPMLKYLGMHGGGGMKQFIDSPELDQVFFKNQEEIMNFLYTNPVIYTRLKDRMFTKRREMKRILNNEPYMDYIWDSNITEVKTEEEPESDKKTRKKSKSE